MPNKLYLPDCECPTCMAYFENNPPDPQVKRILADQQYLNEREKRLDSQAAQEGGSVMRYFRVMFFETDEDGEMCKVLMDKNVLAESGRDAERQLLLDEKIAKKLRGKEFTIRTVLICE